MSKFLIDLSDYRSNVSDRIAEGTYTAVIDYIEDGESKKTHNKMLTIWIVVQGGEFSGSTIIDRMVYADERGKAAGRMFSLVNLMQAVGFKTERKRYSLDTDKFIGKTVQIEVEDGQPYQGRVKSEIRGYSPVRGGAKLAEEKSTTVDDLPDDMDDEEEVSADPTDYDEDLEPAKARASEAMAKARTTPAPAAKPEPEPAPDGDTDEPEFIDLDSIDLG